MKFGERKGTPKGTRNATRKGTRKGTRGRPPKARVVALPEGPGDGVPARVSDAPLSDAPLSGEGHAENSGYVRSALSAFAEIVNNPDAPPMSRTHAARALAEISGLLGRHQQAPREREHAEHVSLLTRAELERELVRLRAVFRGDMEPRP